MQLILGIVPYNFKEKVRIVFLKKEKQFGFDAQIVLK